MSIISAATKCEGFPVARPGRFLRAGKQAHHGERRQVIDLPEDVQRRAEE